MEAHNETASFADWFDALRKPQDAEVASADVTLLTADLRERLDACVARYEKQTNVSGERRSRNALMLMGATPAQQRNAVAYLADRLALRVVSVDAQEIAGQDDHDAWAKLQTLTEETARIAMVTGLTSAADARLRDAIAWSSRETIVVAALPVGVEPQKDLRNAFTMLVDLASGRRFGRGFFALGVLQPRR